MATCFAATNLVTTFAAIATESTASIGTAGGAIATCAADYLVVIDDSIEDVIDQDADGSTTVATCFAAFAADTAAATTTTAAADVITIE
jgi:hypothetical protein